MFWDIIVPSFNVMYSPSPILITDVKDTVFSLTNANFNLNSLSNYTVSWDIDPDLND